ncbi:MAG: ATP-binding protein [Candidatus Moranbacteria bacterium]|nr:ATP-binding protein [Candidatus Moranbacteria bacterium]
MLGINFYIITHFFTAIVSLFVSYITFSKNRKSVTHITLSLLSLFVAIWAAFYSIWLLSNNETQALFWSRLLNLGATFIPVFLLHWILSFLGLTGKKKRLLFLYYILTFIFVFFSYSKYYISSVKPIRQFLFWPQAGWLYVLFLLFCWLPIFFYSFYLLNRELKKAGPVKKQQIYYIFFGAFIGFLGGSTNYFLMFGIEKMSPVGSIFSITFPVLFSYAVIKHRLMDIKFVMRKSSVYALSLLSILLITVFLSFIINGFDYQEVGWVDLLLLVLATSFFPKVKDFYYHLANKYFFSSLYDGQKVIAKLSEKLSSTLNIDEIHNYIYESLDEAFHLKSFGILRYIKKNKSSGGTYFVQFNRGFKIQRDDNTFHGDKFLYSYYIAKGKPLVVEEIKDTPIGIKAKKTIRLLEKYGVAVLSPLNIGKDTIGLIVLGYKETRDIYNDEDLQVLEIIGVQAAMAIQNALQYEAAKDFNVRLQKEVAEATEELRHANRKLIQLDKAKTEFLSIASHQLRTPLTAIKGFTSLLLDGSYGKLDENVKEVLNKIFLSNEKLVTLTENLLNISRIEAGRLVFNLEKNEIASLVKEVVEELRVNAEKKGIKLDLELPQKPISPFIFDRGKIHEVIINLIDNAIKYTDQGSVNVELKNKKNSVVITVKDTGIGIPPDEMDGVLKKFQRASNAIKVHTEGAGIGMYIVSQIIKAHNGKLNVASGGVGKGTTVTVELDKKFKPKKQEE